MYSSILNSSLLILILINLFLINKTISLPIDKSSFYSNNNYESTSLSSSSSNLNDQPESETVSKILRLMHSLSNKSILIPSSPTASLTNHQNFNLQVIKRENNDNKNFNLNDNDNKLTERLKELNKFKNRFNDNLSTERIINERFNDDFNDNQSNENSNIFEKLKLKELNNREFNSASLNAKYPSSAIVDEQFNSQQQKNEPSFIRANSNKFSEFIRSSNEDDSTIQAVTNPTFIKLLNKLSERINEENKELASKSIIDKDQFERFEFKNTEFNNDLKDELNHNTKDQKKNLYDMVENEEEDNIGDEEHMHNYNISLLSDLELNRTLMDIQYLLNNNLSKQEIESKFSSKGRNNRNKIANKLEYFQQLYRNLHNLSLPQNQKRGEGPQLSVVSPLDILRDKLILEIARRKLEQSKSQMKENEDYLKKIG